MGMKTGARVSSEQVFISGMCLCARPSAYGRGALSAASIWRSPSIWRACQPWYCSIIFLPPPE